MTKQFIRFLAMSAFFFIAFIRRINKSKILKRTMDFCTQELAQPKLSMPSSFTSLFADQNGWLLSGLINWIWLLRTGQQTTVFPVQIDLSSKVSERFQTILSFSWYSQQKHTLQRKMRSYLVIELGYSKESAWATFFWILKEKALSKV